MNTNNWQNNQFMRNSDYEISYYVDTHFSNVALHSHDFYELYFYISGNATYVVDGYIYELETNDIMLISPSNLHQLNNIDNQKSYERIVLWLNTKYINKLSTSSTNLLAAFNKANCINNHLFRNYIKNNEIKELLINLYELNNSKEFAREIKQEIIIKKILIILAEYSIYNIHKPQSESQKHMSNVIDYINSNLNKDLSLDKLAKACFISKYYLCHLFKSTMNVSLHRYIVKRRLIESKLLIEKNLPIHIVSEQCGFRDYTHFFRAFKQEYGITPKQYYNFTKGEYQ